MPKSVRIKTTPGNEKSLKVMLEQDFEFLEILSLKLNQADIYTRVCSDYGVVVGRVFVNGGYGLPNARVSVFVPIEDVDLNNPIISELYPYTFISDVNEEGYRYNLLPKEPQYNGHVPTGSFPTKQEVLIDNTYIEVFDKYYRYTVKTNESGDYMIFGVPVGTQTLVMDVDLSDIGCFSLSPQDLIQAGVASEDQVNGSKFKSSTNLNELPQIISLNKILEIAPLWGEPEICQLGITRADFDLTASANISIQPTSIFMGSVISTTDDDSVKPSCKPKNNTGNLCELVAGPGQILSIRQTIDTDQYGYPILEQYDLEQNGKIIDDNGTFLVNLPMNLDYVYTNEYGQQVLSNDPKIGIPTTGKYRFKFKWQNEQGLKNNFLRGNYLVPNVKEYGWSNASNDPFITQPPTVLSYNLVPGFTIQTIPIATNGGLVLDNSVNSQSISVTIGGIPYFGDVNVIPITTAPTNVVVTSIPQDVNSSQILNFLFYDQGPFDVLRSYAFSLDWDDYGDSNMIQEAINCEDRFYLFNYNKVYTTSLFLDRYKNGVGRARHLGIKEIDNRTCKSTVNTFPANDIIRNFDFLFFLFNFLLNVLTPALLAVLWLAHFIAKFWPVFKNLGKTLRRLLIIGTVYYWALVVWNLSAAIVALLPIPSGLSISFYVGFGISLVKAIGVSILLRFYNQRVYPFLQHVILDLRRIGLPMISYPECESCDCNCGFAEIGEQFTPDTFDQELQAELSVYSQTGVQILGQSTSFLAPVNMSSAYDVTHPNLEIIPGYQYGDADNGYFRCGGTGQYKSLAWAIDNNQVDQTVVTKAQVDFLRLFSGYDVLGGSEFNKYHAPQPFLFAADKSPGQDDRWFGFPTKQTYPQRLNEFNLRDKYFNPNPGTPGVNQITTTVNPQLAGSQPFKDQVVILLARPGTIDTVFPGDLITFQDPNFSNGQVVSRKVNLTGATSNQFLNNAVTGTTLLSPFPLGSLTPTPISQTISYANPNNQSNNLFSTIKILQTGTTSPALTKEDFLKYDTDVEYFQLLTGLTVNQFYALDSNTLGYFPQSYLKHQIQIVILDPCGPSTTFPTNGNPVILPTNISSNYNPNAGANSIQSNNFVALENMANYDSYEVLILTRGVDPHTTKQNIEYDLSVLFGYPSAPGTVMVSGDYYLNYPIQGVGVNALSHISTNNTTNLLYFPSFTFSISPPTPGNPNYTAFTSPLPYYYLATSDTTVPSGLAYVPVNNFQTVSSLTFPGNNSITTANNFVLPQSVSRYIGGGPFIAAEFNVPINSLSFYDNVPNLSDYGYPLNNSVSANIYALYSQAYFKYTLSQVNFSDRTRIVMRSDRLPTSTCIEDGPGIRTSFALHQNNNFCYFLDAGVGFEQSQNFGGSFDPSEFLDQFSGNTSLTNTFTCEGMKPLQCYTGSGRNVGVYPTGQCPVPDDIMINGCYCLLNEEYLFEGYKRDVRYFLEWKARFILMYALCRGVFAQTFQNNWINGVLYMPSFTKRSVYPSLNNISNPTYVFCKDFIYFNTASNNFYYRSSPYSKSLNSFIGKKMNLPPLTLGVNPGYNDKQIQFPTTILDLGPRDFFIKEICSNPAFGSYFSNELVSTSYNDQGEIVQFGFLSRLLNSWFRGLMIPDSSGILFNWDTGLNKFFDSARGGSRIDGDIAQSISINSEFKINPFYDENYPLPTDVYLGDDGIPPNFKPVFGVFYRSNFDEYSTRREMSPGLQIYNLLPLIQTPFGYPNSQEVPTYKWQLTTSLRIFGTENNNWYTQANQNVTNNGFISKKYQSFDFNTDYFTTATLVSPNFLPNLPQGYITNFNALGQTDENVPQNNNLVVVGLPNHMYFGLNNGKTAVNRFIKLYVDTAEQ